MLRPIAPVLALALAIGCASPAQRGGPTAGAEATSATGRRLQVELAVTVPKVEDGGPLHVFVPLPRDASAQRVSALAVHAPIEGRIETDALGNRFWHGESAGPREGFEIAVRATVERLPRSSDPVAGAALSDGDRERLAPWLASTDRVPLGDVTAAELSPILEELGPAPAGAAARARQIYEWVVDNVEYKKTGSGWGNGDIFWACSERYGNCTDFHTLLLALARTEGIPGRFEMGFPIPMDRPSGSIGGYHCWVELWLPGATWIPIDASEAAKHPEDRELHFGGEEPDRVLFTRGRDLRLGDDHQGPALNYFIHTFAELDGSRLDGVEQTVRYEELP
jgi:transglutaminase-like putative cysteine protease